MRRLLTLPLAATLALAALSHAQAATQWSKSFAISYTIDFKHDESDATAAAITLHGVGATQMHAAWDGAHYTCRFDPYRITFTVNGQVLHKEVAGSSCDSQSDPTSVFSSLDLSHLPAHPQGHWTSAQTMTVSQAMQWPISQQIASLLSPVSWRTEYASDGHTFVTAHGSGAMLEDRAVAVSGGQAHLHAHLSGDSVLSAHVQKLNDQYVPASMTMRQSAHLFLHITNGVTGADVTEHDQTSVIATLHPL